MKLALIMLYTHVEFPRQQDAEAAASCIFCYIFFRPDVLKFHPLVYDGFVLELVVELFLRNIYLFEITYANTNLVCLNPRGGSWGGPRGPQYPSLRVIQVYNYVFVGEGVECVKPYI